MPEPSEVKLLKAIEAMGQLTLLDLVNIKRADSVEANIFLHMVSTATFILEILGIQQQVQQEPK